MSYPPPPPAQPYGQPSGSPQRLRGRTPLRLALIFFLVGLALVIAGAVVLDKKSFSKVNGFQRVSVAAGQGTVNFTGTGNYVAYYEAPGADGKTNDIPLSLITLTSPSGKSTQLTTLYGGSSLSSKKIKSRLTYSYNGHDGVAVYQFKIDQTGSYRVTIQRGGFEASNSDIAFGRSIGTGTAVGAALLVPGVLLIVAAIVLLIVGVVKRSRHKKELASGGGFYGAPPPGQYPGGYPQQPGYPQQQGYPQQGNPQQGYPPPGQAPGGWSPPQG
jgi:hypothetical protein